MVPYFFHILIFHWIWGFSKASLRHSPNFLDYVQKHHFPRRMLYGNLLPWKTRVLTNLSLAESDDVILWSKGSKGDIKAIIPTQKFPVLGFPYSALFLLFDPSTKGHRDQCTFLTILH